MKTNLNVPITTSEEAKNYIIDLFNNNESYHPEDDAFDIIWGEDADAPTEAECEKLNDNMALVYDVADFDPCDVLCELLDQQNAGE